MVSKVINGVTVTVTNEHGGQVMPRWMIVSIQIDGLPPMRSSSGSYETSADALEAGFLIAANLKFKR